MELIKLNDLPYVIEKPQEDSVDNKDGQQGVINPF